MVLRGKTPTRLAPGAPALNGSGKTSPSAATSSHQTLALLFQVGRRPKLRPRSFQGWGGSVPLRRAGSLDSTAAATGCGLHGRTLMSRVVWGAARGQLRPLRRR